MQRLRSANGGKIALTEETFEAGRKRMQDQISKYPNRILPHLIVGLNTHGEELAKRLLENGAFDTTQCRIEIVKTGTKNNEGKREFSPSEIPYDWKYDCCVIIDGQVKSGESLKTLRGMLQAHRPKAKIYSFVLGQVLEKIDINSVAYDVDAEDKPDLVAFYSEHPGFSCPQSFRQDVGDNVGIRA